MQILEAQIKEIIRHEYDIEADVVLTRPEKQFGDLSTNVALQLSKKVGKNPRDVASTIAESITKNISEIVSKAEIAGPGFINITFQGNVLLKGLESIIELPQSLKGKIVVAEYSDPNPFKVLHAGHLYTTIVGDAVSRLLQASGAEIHRLNYGGDVGRHVGITMWAIVKFLGGEYPEKLSDVAENDRLEWLSARYVEGNESYETDPDVKEAITAYNKRVYELHSSDDHTSEFAKIYWTCREWSYDGFDTLYQELQVSPFEKYVPESEVTSLGLETVHAGLEKGIFTKSEGAVVFQGEEHGLHTRVFINSNGLPLYEAKELGLAVKKWQDYHFDLSVVITANDISEYMKVVLKALSNFYPEVSKRTRHLTHGVIKLPGGVKMSSRKGNILRATDIITAAEIANKELAETSSHETVLAAIKYSFLKNRIGGDVIYNPSESVAIEGNSGPYLQYSHARARSILGKVTEQKLKPITNLEEGERVLVVKLLEYTEVFEKAVYDLTPHLICTYLYELAQEFNRFYEKNRVIGDSREVERLQLVKIYSQILASGLNLLGIHAPDKM